MESQYEQIVADGKMFTILYPDMLRPLTSEEFESLVDSVRKYGVQTPVIVQDYKTFGIIDGIHRVRAYARLESEGQDLPELPVTMPEIVMSEDQQRTLALELNLERRQLTPAEVQQHRSNAAKREAARKAVLADPTRSNNAIAKEVGVSDKTVASVRTEMESTSEIPKSEGGRVGADGRTINAANIGKRKEPEPTPRPEVKPVKSAPPALVQAEVDHTPSSAPPVAAPVQQSPQAAPVPSLPPAPAGPATAPVLAEKATQRDAGSIVLSPPKILLEHDPATAAQQILTSYGEEFALELVANLTRHGG